MNIKTETKPKENFQTDKITPQMQKNYERICAGKEPDGNKVVGSIYE
tara:strand:+ start:662 stop:802 length:141 start_codon:yes stop_codon:yes gene_type:complete